MLSKKQLFEVCRILDKYYPKTRLHNKKNPLHEAIFILLTSQTDERKYIATWGLFRKRFPTLEAAGKASVNQIYRAIKGGGLGRWKAERIYNLFRYIKDRYGKYSLSPLKTLDNSLLEKELLRLDGISFKGARCIMLYSFNRDVFPVDTHTIRIARRIGFEIPNSSSRSKAFADSLQVQVPKIKRFRLHVNFIQHGRLICIRNPKCKICPITNICSKFGVTRVD